MAKGPEVMLPTRSPSVGAQSCSSNQLSRSKRDDSLRLDVAMARRTGCQIDRVVQIGLCLWLKETDAFDFVWNCE